MTRIEAVLFDKDGTLFDFEASWSALSATMIRRLAGDDDARAEAMADLSGFDLATHAFRPGAMIVTASGEDLARLWAPVLPHRAPAEVAAAINAMSADEMTAETLVPAVPDLAGLLAELRAMGLKLGVATNDGEAAARAHLAMAGVLDAFDLVLGADSGHGGKPGRGMLDAFASTAGVPHAAIAMVGDGIHDLAMKDHGAGLAIGVLTGVAGRDDLAPFADHVLPSIAALPRLLGAVAA